MDSHRRKTPIKNVAVIGAGFSGLVSSLLLARSGKEVVLIERQERIAPLLSNQTYDGFEVNNAFQYVGGYYPGSALYASFERLGLNDELIPKAFDESGPDCFLGVADRALSIPVGLEKVQAVLTDVFPGNDAVLTEYFEIMEEVFQEFSFFGLRDFFSKTTVRLASVSLKEFLVKRKAGAELVDFLSIYSEMLLGVTAVEVPLLNHLLGVGAYFLSAHTFKGGGGALVSALKRKVQKAGVQIMTNSDVVQILADSHRKYTGLRIRSKKNNETVSLNTDACISTLHPRRLLQLLPPGPSSENYGRRIANYRNTKSICLYHLVLDHPAVNTIRQNRHVVTKDEKGTLVHQLAVLPSTIANGEEKERKQKLSVLIRAWSNDGDGSCPGRKRSSSVKVKKWGENFCRQSKPEFLDRIGYNMVSKLERNFPDLSGRYRIIRTLTPCDFDRINRSWQGSVYGVKCSVDRHDFTTLGPLTKLSLSGQSVIAPGIYGCLIASYLAVERLMR